MIGKKSSRLVDLEYMIPKEHKPLPEVVEDAPSECVSGETAWVRAVCHSCGRSSDESPLMPVFYGGEDRWMCPVCLKSSMAIASSPAGSYTEEKQDWDAPPASGSAMSMFD